MLYCVVIRSCLHNCSHCFQKPLIESKIAKDEGATSKYPESPSKYLVSFHVPANQILETNTQEIFTNRSYAKSVLSVGISLIFKPDFESPGRCYFLSSFSLRTCKSQTCFNSQHTVIYELSIHRNRFFASFYEYNSQKINCNTFSSLIAPWWRAMTEKRASQITTNIAARKGTLIKFWSKIKYEILPDKWLSLQWSDTTSCNVHAEGHRTSARSLQEYRFTLSESTIVIKWWFEA